MTDKTNSMDLPLVSIVVITFRSAKTVVETLESIKGQTYKPIELIVTDDCSPDDSVEIIQKWVIDNQDRFTKATLVTTEQNTGTSGNLNRGIEHVTGKYIKIIAGDDILLPDCIAANVTFAQQHNSNIVFSRMIFFSGDQTLKRGQLTLEQKRFFKKDQAAKFKSYIRYPIFLNIPTIFLKTGMVRKLGGFLEDFRLLEDQPFVIKALSNGYDIDFLNQETVKYRIHTGSITGTGNMNFINETYKSYLTYRKPYLKSGNLVDAIFRNYINLDFYFKLKGFNRAKPYRLFNRAAILIRLLS